MQNWRIIIHVEDTEAWASKIEKLLMYDKHKKRILGATATTLMIANPKNLDEAIDSYSEYTVEGHTPELVILDIDLEGGTNDLSGVEFAKRLVGLGFTKKTNIILLSGNMNIEKVQKALEAENLPVFARFDKATFADHIGEFVDAVAKCMNQNYKYRDFVESGESSKEDN